MRFLCRMHPFHLPSRHPEESRKTTSAAEDRASPTPAADRRKERQNGNAGMAFALAPSSVSASASTLAFVHCAPCREQVTSRSPVSPTAGIRSRSTVNVAPLPAAAALAANRAAVRFLEMPNDGESQADAAPQAVE